MANRHVTRCSTVLMIKEMQIKPVRDHLAPVRKAVIKKDRNDKGWLGFGQNGTHVHGWQGCKLMQPLHKKTVWRCLLKLKIELPYLEETSAHLKKNLDKKEKNYKFQLAPTVL